jgi:hypothetical protein
MHKSSNFQIPKNPKSTNPKSSMAAAGSSSLVCRRSSPNSRVEELYRAEQVDEATMAAAGRSSAPPDGRGRTSAPPPPQVSCSGRVRHAPPPSTQIEVVGRAWSSAPTRGRRGTTGWRKLRRRPVSLRCYCGRWSVASSRAQGSSSSPPPPLRAHTRGSSCSPLRRPCGGGDHQRSDGELALPSAGEPTILLQTALDCNSRIEILERGRKGFFFEIRGRRG